MPEGSIATAYVNIKPDLSEFREELRAGLETADDDLKKTVKVDANTGEARAEIDVLQARIDELSSESATIKIGTKGSARSEITDIQSALDQFRNESLVPGLDPARMEQLNAELDGLDGRLRTVDTDLDTTASKADRASKSLGNDGAGGGLLAVAVAAAPALGTVGAVGAGALAGIAVAAGAGALGLGAFGLAAKNNLTAAKTEATGLLTTWQATQDRFTQPVITEALQLIPPALSFLSPSVATASSALLSLEGSVSGALGSPYWTSFSQYIAGEGGQAIRSVGTLFGGAAHLLSGFAEGFAPELQRIDDDTSRWAADMTKWGNEARNGGMSGFLDYIQANGPLVAHALEQLGSDFVTLAKASAPLGPIWLNVLNVAAELLGDLEKLNPTLTTWGIGLGSVAFAANRLLSPLGGLAGIAAAAPALWSAASDAFTVGATGLYSIATASSGAAGGLLSFVADATGAVPGLDLVGAAILQATGQFDNFDAGIEKATSKWAQGFVASLPAGVNQVQAVAQEIASLNDSIKITQPQIDQLSSATKYFGTQLNQLPPSLQAAGQAMINSGAQPTDTLGKANKDLFNYMEQVSGQTKALQSALRGLTPEQLAQALATGRANDAMAAAAGYTGNAALQFGNLSNQLKTANTQLTQTETLLNNLLGAELSVAQNTTAFYQAVDNLSNSLKTNGTQLQGTTTKALANQQAFEGVGSSITSLIGSMEKQGSTSDQIVGKVQSLTSYIETQAGKYGLTKSQVDNYLHSLGLTPAQVKTDLELSGYSTASAQVSSINSQLNALNGKHVTFTMTPYLTPVAAPVGIAAKPAHASGLRAGSMGTHMALVGEEGPEAEITRSGRVRMLGAKGPEVAQIPAGAAILTAAQTRRLPRHADGLDGGPLLEVAPEVQAVTYAPTVQVMGSTDEKTLGLIQAALDANNAELLQLVGAP